MSAPRIFASDIPPNVPEGWREAANWHIERNRGPGMDARLRRIIADARMLPFWRAVDSLNGVVSQQRMLALLVGGAYAPAENPGEIMSRRRKIAAKAHELAELIAGDADARHIDVEELLHWACPIEGEFVPLNDGGEEEPEFLSPSWSTKYAGTRVFVEAEGNWVSRPILVTDEARHHGAPPSATTLLKAMAARLESTKPVWCFDPLERPGWAVSREVSATTRLVRTLAAETGHMRDSIGWDLIALAANVATDANIDGSKARAIWRAFLRSNQQE